MPFVLDASVALSWCFEDESDKLSDRILEQLIEDEALVPAIWPFEVGNVLCAAERANRLSAADISALADLFVSLPITIEDVKLARVLTAGVSIAREQNLSTYDACYLELAMRHGVPIATKDRALRAAAKRVGVPVVK